MITVILLIFCSLWILDFYWKNKRRFSKNHSSDPPELDGAWPLIGHTYLVFSDTKKIWQRYTEIVNKMFRNNVGVHSFRFGPFVKNYFIVDPDDYYTVAKTCLKKGIIYDIIKPLFGNGLLTADVDMWKIQRKLLNRTMNHQTLNSYHNIMNEQARALVINWKTKAGNCHFNPSKDIQKNNLETLCMTTMDITDGIELQKMKNDYVETIEIMSKIFTERILNVWSFNEHLYKWSGLKARHSKILNILHDFPAMVLNKKMVEVNQILKESPENGTGRPKIFLDVLLDFWKKGDFNEDTVRDNMNTIMAAGHETTAKSLVYMLVLLGSYPKVQDKVYTELQEIFSVTKRDVQKQDIPRLKYLDAVIKETLRLYPVAPVIFRYIDCELKLKNCVLPADSHCLLSIYAVNRHPIWGPDRELFKPERWLDPTTLPDNPNASATFSLGRRNCIGSDYGMMILRINLVHILREYRVLADESKMTLKLEFLVVPDDVHKIFLEHRNIK